MPGCSATDLFLHPEALVGPIAGGIDDFAAANARFQQIEANHIDEAELVERCRTYSKICNDKLAGDPVDVLVNERLVARGEVLVLNDNFCVRISEIVAGLALPTEAQAAAS